MNYYTLRIENRIKRFEYPLLEYLEVLEGVKIP